MSTPTKIGPDTISPERAPALGVPLRWFLTALAFLAMLLAFALWKAPLLAADYLHNPATLAVTHLFTLGFGGSVVTGALYQMVPVLLYSKLYNERLSDVHLAVHGAGALLMVVGFYYAQTWFVIVGGSLVVIGSLLFLLNLGLTFRRAERWNWHGAFMAAAVIYYLSTLTWGLVMALNQRYGFLGEVEGAPLSGHLTLGLLGWFSLMIVAVGLKLVPMFAPAKSLPAPFVAATAGSLAAAVPVMLAGLWLGPVVLWIGGVLAFGGLAGYAGLSAYSYLHRRSGPLDFSIRFSLTAAGCMLLAVLLFPWAGRDFRAGLVFFYAFGFIGGTILGMLLRILPFVVWLHRFRNRTHKQEKIPFLHELFNRRLGWVALLAWFPGAACMAAGVAMATPLLVTAGALLGAVALVGFVLAVRQVLHHVKPGTPALFPGQK